MNGESAPAHRQAVIQAQRVADAEADASATIHAEKQGRISSFVVGSMYPIAQTALQLSAYLCLPIYGDQDQCLSLYTDTR